MSPVKGAAAVLLVLLAGLGAACSGGDDGGQPVASSQCSSLLYEGEGRPDVVVVSDLPRRGIAAETTKLMVDAIEFVLRRRGFRAGDHRVGYQSCNDAVGDEPYDPALCRRNARAYVAADDLVGVIGSYNSGCSYEQIPILSRREAGPLAMVSPANTFVGLTRTFPGQRSGDALYPDGLRSYFRVVTHDHAQGIAAAHLAARLGARRAVVVHQDFSDIYVRALAVSFVQAAGGLGLDVDRFKWRFQDRYVQLAASVASARPDAVFLAGLTQENAKTLVQDLRAALDPRVLLIAPDSFAADDIALGLGRAGEGLLVTVPGIPPERLPPAGRAFVRDFGPAFAQRGGLGAPEAAQAADVLLEAISRSDGTRSSVVDELARTKVEGGILGSFTFDRYGDINPAPVGIYRFEGGKIVVEGVVRAPLEGVGD